MSRQDDIAEKAVRKSTLKSLKAKKIRRLSQLKLDYEQAVRDVNIQYAEDPERLKAKYAAQDYARSERAKKRAEKRIALEKKMIEESKLSRKLTVGEEISSSIIQGFGAALFIAGTAVLESIAVRTLKSYVNITTVFYALFGASMILMYLFSLLHHAITNYNAKIVFDRLSHVFSFLIIGFGYSAYTITKIQGQKGWVLFGIVWIIVLAGILLYAIGGKKVDKIALALYIIAGFSGLVVAKSLFEVLSGKSFSMLAFGAAFYLVGIIFYNLQKIKYMHLISNIIMLFGSVYIFFSLFYLGA